MVTVHNLDHESVAKMTQLDLATVDREPESPIGNFSFHGCTGGVAAFKGRPPWEYHGQGDELLFILAGESELTVLEEDSRSIRTLSSGPSCDCSEGSLALQQRTRRSDDAVDHSWRRQ